MLTDELARYDGMVAAATETARDEIDRYKIDTKYCFGTEPELRFRKTRRQDILRLLKRRSLYKRIYRRTLQEEDARLVRYFLATNPEIPFA